MNQISGIKITKIKNIATQNGSVLHALKYSDNNLDTFAETYFSLIKKGNINGWKMHKAMTLNLIVPVGEVRFNFIDTRLDSSTKNARMEITLSRDNYYRITVPPFITFAFKGLSNGDNLVTNISNLEHDDNECIQISLEKYKFI